MTAQKKVSSVSYSRTFSLHPRSELTDEKRRGNKEESLFVGGFTVR